MPDEPHYSSAKHLSRVVPLQLTSVHLEPLERIKTTTDIVSRP
jgi:hypothetical protein